jgi:hypothetical protein
MGFVVNKSVTGTGFPRELQVPTNGSVFTNHPIVNTFIFKLMKRKLLRLAGYVASIRAISYELGFYIPETAFFIVTTVKTSNLK